MPSRPFRAGDEQARLELQPTPGGLLALMAYSSRETLLAGCGPAQPWVSIPAGLLDEARQEAGADTIALDTPLPEWLQQWRGGWVRTYELAKVTASSHVTGTQLSLTDRGGRKIQINSEHIQEDRLMWDLVYNGIVHSVVAGGAETNGALHSIFDVPRPKPEPW